jgi:hypothetical protein
MTFSIAGSRVMMNTNLEQFLDHNFLLQITFLSPETITHKIAIFQMQQTAPLLPLPEINFNLPRRICVTRDQPQPGSYLKKREEPGNEVARNHDFFPNFSWDTLFSAL